jgi:ribosome-binding protein aMBF1 (putative translation factor)
MARPRKTGFDKFFDEQVASPSFAKEYGEARAEIDAIDRIVRTLDLARDKSGMSKADLARAISAKPEIVRRLFTTSTPNPTLSTVIRLARALGYDLALVPAARARRRNAA